MYFIGLFCVFIVVCKKVHQFGVYLDYQIRNLSRYFSDVKQVNENAYLCLLTKIMNEGVEKSNRTDTPTKELFGEMMTFDLEDFPLLTTKKMAFRAIAEELLWFLNGKTDSKILEEKNIKIWNGNSKRETLDSLGLQEYEDGDCGPIYGFNFRHFGAEYKNCNTDYSDKGFDQIKYVINEIKTNPNSRRIMMSLYNPVDVHKSVLPPCHVLYQFNIVDGKLNCCLYQRSADMFLGVPFNIASASLLTYIIAFLTNLQPGKLTHMLGNCHIYKNHYEQVRTQLCRSPLKFPKLKIVNRSQKNVEDFTFDDFKLENYMSYPKLSGKMVI